MTKTDAEKAAEEHARGKYKGAKVEFHSIDSNGVIVSIALPIENVHRIVRHSFLAGAAWAAPKWVSVKERLPEEDQEMLVWSKAANQAQMARMTTRGLETIHDHLITSALQFTHWMPLPAAPKEEK